MRLDLYISQNNQKLSRTKAEELIKLNLVKVNGLVISKPSHNISEDDNIEILKENYYVSRSAEKLRLFLNSIKLDCTDFICVDVGASSGGFSQILLEENVSKIYAVDVGTMQLDESLKNHQKIISVENCDIRDYICHDKVNLVVCDVSFISVMIILEKMLDITSKYLVILFKPQYEVGKGIKRDSRGVVKDNFAIDKSMKNFETFALSLGCKMIEKQKSQVKGKNGNEEYFYFFEK